METRAPRLNWLSVSYFGGEPLLGMETVEETAPAAQKTAAAHGIQYHCSYHCSITTNGYLPTGEVFEKLVGWNLRQYQITLDRERECHDHSRPLKGGGSTFDRILENLRTIKLTAHDFKVTLCGNFTPVNLRSMRSFLEEIGDFKDDKSYSIRSFLPVCQGSSCPLPRLELRKRPCPPQRLHIGKTLTNIWQQKEGKGRLYSIQNRDFVARSHVEDRGPATM